MDKLPVKGRFKTIVHILWMPIKKYEKNTIFPSGKIVEKTQQWDYWVCQRNLIFLEQ